MRQHIIGIIIAGLIFALGININKAWQIYNQPLLDIKETNILKNQSTDEFLILQPIYFESPTISVDYFLPDEPGLPNHSNRPWEYKSADGIILNVGEWEYGSSYEAIEAL